jgi:hypothetical protein
MESDTGTDMHIHDGVKDVIEMNAYLKDATQKYLDEAESCGFSIEDTDESRMHYYVFLIIAANDYIMGIE